MYIFFLFILYHGLITAVDGEGVRDCVQAIRRLHRGNGEEVCFVCEPVNEECPAGCQELLDNFHKECKDVCLPETYWFDTQEFTKFYNRNTYDTRKGCYNDHKESLLRDTVRCGCAAGSAGVSPSMLLVSLFLGMCCFLAAF